MSKTKLESIGRREAIAVAVATAALFGFTAETKAAAKPAPGLKVPKGHHLYFVTSNFVAGKEAEYRAWYIRHIEQIVQIPGFVSAQQLVYAPTEGRTQPAFQYMVIYEINGDPNEVIGRLGPAVAAGKLERPDPALFIRAGSWVYSPVYPI
jgi:hypothetical protein